MSAHTRSAPSVSAGATGSRPSDIGTSGTSAETRLKNSGAFQTRRGIGRGRSGRIPRRSAPDDVLRVCCPSVAVPPWGRSISGTARRVPAASPIRILMRFWTTTSRRGSQSSASPLGWRLEACSVAAPFPRPVRIAAPRPAPCPPMTPATRSGWTVGRAGPWS